MAKKLSKTSVQLTPEIIEWLDTWPTVNRSEALRLALERYKYLVTPMNKIEEFALKYRSILAPALQEFLPDNFRAVARALPAIVGSYIQENQDQDLEWLDEDANRPIDTGDLYNQLEAMNAIQRIYLLDCIVAQRDRAHTPTEDRLKGRHP